MSDLSKLSNDELMRMYKGGGNAPAPKTVNPPSDLSRFSDEELMQLYQKPQVEPAVPAPNMLNEIGRAVGRTVRSGGAGALGMLDLAETPIRMGMAGIADVIGAPQSAEQLRTDKTLSQGFKDTIDRATGGTLQPRNSAERYADTATEFMGGGMIPAAGMARMGAPAAETLAGKAVQFLAPRTATDVVGAGTAGLANQYAQDNNYGVAGTALATLAGGAAPALARSTPELALKAVTPKIETETAKLAQRAQEFGIPLSVNQVAPTRLNSTIQKASQPLPFSGVGGFESKQISDWNRALAKRALGQDAEALTPEVVQNFLSSSGKQFDSILSGKSVSATVDDIAALKTISGNAKDFVTGDLAAIIQRNVNDLMKDIGKGKSIPGEKLASYRSRLIDNIPKAQNESKVYLYDLLETVDNIAEKSMSKQDVDSLKTLRRQWRNWKTVEPLLEGSKDGIINPTALMSRVASSPYIKAARKQVGEDDLVDLARIGKMIPKLGGSDTYDKAVLTGGVGFGGATNPLLTGGLLAGNRGYQKFYNQSQGLISRGIAKSLEEAKRDAIANALRQSSQ
jgi:hypothetical protein